MRCSNCGAGLPPASRFCNACGAAVAAAPPSHAPQGGAHSPHATGQYGAPSPPPYAPPAPAAASQNNRIILISGLIALALVGAVGAGVYFKNAAASSVVAAPGAAPKKAPSMVAMPGRPEKESSSIVTAPSRPEKPAEPVAQRDNSDFDKYLAWLKFVEDERAGLRALGETQVYSVVEDYLQAMLAQSEPDADGMEFQRRIQARLDKTVQAMHAFEQNIMRTRPQVPADCQALDQFYLAALKEEIEATPKVMQGLASGDIGAIKRAGSEGVARIDRNLGQANLALSEVYRGRGLNQQFRIQTGSGSSMLGGLTGLGGMPGL
ncbi:MAG: zinc-ribbon domain-containing protein [Armatimonadota bacterium]